MNPDKCDKCCIGWECSMDDGVYLVDEGFHGYLEEGFSFCPHCGFALPEYVRPEPEPRKASKPGPLDKFNETLWKLYEPAIEEMLKPSMLSDLIKKEEKARNAMELTEESFIDTNDQLS